MQGGNFLASCDHFFFVFAKHSLLDAHEMVPHVKGVAVVACTLEESGEKGDDLLEEWMVPVAFSVGDLGLEHAV